MTWKEKGHPKIFLKNILKPPLLWKPDVIYCVCSLREEG